MEIDTSSWAGPALVSFGNLAAWIAETEQIWFPIVGAYTRWIAPAYNLPDLRGPFVFVALLYVGLRIGDMLNKKEEIEP